MKKRLFTSESVTEGHPDKICDQISDAVLDALLEQDPNSHVACETACTTGIVLVMGEIRTNAYVDIQKIVRETIREIGYDNATYGFDCDTCGVIKQSMISQLILLWVLIRHWKQRKIRWMTAKSKQSAQVTRV